MKAEGVKASSAQHRLALPPYKQTTQEAASAINPCAVVTGEESSEGKGSTSFAYITEKHTQAFKALASPKFYPPPPPPRPRQGHALLP
jgi:hypothetical protein